MRIFKLDKRVFALGLSLFLLGILISITALAFLNFDFNNILKNSGNIYSPIGLFSKW